MDGKPCVKIEKSWAQHAKNILLQHRLLDPSRRPVKERDHVLFPVTSPPDASVAREIGHGFDLVHDCMAAGTKVVRGTVAERLTGQVPATLLPVIPRSFNITGHVCILELDPAVEPFRAIIAAAVCKVHPNVTTVYAKASERSGDARTSQLELVHGPDDPVTAHVENGITYRLDVKRVFFDPRLGNEHARVAGAIAAMARSTNVSVLDAYCGVGPFVVPLSVISGVSILAVDSNPVAIDFLRENVTRNKGNLDTLHVACDDAKVIMEAASTRERFPAGFNAILMNLPRHAHQHLGPASRLLARGGRIYWYTIAPALFEGKTVTGDAARTAATVVMEGQAGGAHANPVDGILVDGVALARQAGLRVDAITRVKPYAPYRFIHCVELVHGSST